MDSDTLERLMQEIAAKIPEGRVTSGLAPGEENQRALDAWIEAGAIPGDEHLYSLVDVDDADEDEDADGE